jgi:hypothetical protein
MCFPLPTLSISVSTLKPQHRYESYTGVVSRIICSKYMHKESVL